MKTRWQDWLNLIFGVWLFFSPWLLQYFTGQPYTYQTLASWNSIIIGGAIVVFAVRVLFVPKIKNWEEWSNLILGLWLLISPWVLGFSTHAVAAGNAAIAGLCVAVVSATAVGRQHPRHVVQHEP
ncbi:MAG: SPW repeat protein [Gammaproteobacteria bacterium]